MSTTTALKHQASSQSLSNTLVSQIRVHQGAIDRRTITTVPPSQAMDNMRALLLRMGVRVRDESAFRLRCVRPGAGAPNSDAKWDEAWDEVDEEEKDEFSSSSSGSESESSGSGSDTETEAHAARAPKRAPKRNVQVHRISQTQIQEPECALQPLRVSSSRSNLRRLKSKQSMSLQKCTLYGPSPASDPSHEVRFSVELTQLSGLPGTYSLDIRRLKGHLRSYKYIYDTLRELSLSFIFNS
ncbi:hypothetical protein JR316_0011067 [Psilocybe cubensis]|uniref:KA1 domain-containing protein n=2 Tax=Psilocybe cubensis TaxID=181762 RepID=A0A8H8CEL5_PSICU|nr:hypothetical protein JR316_0011067 [Psilocybe cubensis]KAH9477150.1 hypothetical protein JR316_0011067 [Psilocybe cubensis]